MPVLSMDVPDQVLASLRYDPEEMVREMRLTAAAAWYAEGKVSQEVAAAFAGMDRTDFLLALPRRGVPSLRADFADLDRELALG